MYDTYYNFDTLPFENTPNPRFFYASEQHREALAAIEYTIRMRKGIVLVTGPTGIGDSDDPVAAPKVLVKFAKENDNLIILGGMMGEMVLDENAVRDLAALPSLDELHGKLVSLLSAPATKIAGVLQAPAGQLARVFGAYGAIETA